MSLHNQIETCFEYFTRRLKEGWHCISLDYPFVLLASKGIIQTLDLSNDVETLRPNAAGDNSELAAVGDSPNYACVDESSADDDSTYVNRSYTQTTYYLDLYNLPAHSGSGTINSVTIHARSRKTHDVGHLKIACKTHSTVYYGSEELLGASYVNYSKQYTTNPNTSSAWTWAEIDALQIGVSLKHLIQGPPETNQGTRCTQVYVEVNYTAPIPLAGVIAATSSVTGSLTRFKLLAGTIGASSTVDGNLDLTWALSGAIPTVSAVTGALGLQRPISGVITTSTSVSGDVTKTKRLVGNINAVSTVQGKSICTWALGGSSDAITNIIGSLCIERPLSGQITQNTTVIGLLGLKRPFSGVVAANATTSASLMRYKLLAGAINSVSTTSGILPVEKQLIGAIDTLSTVSGSLPVEKTLAGTIDALSTISGSLEVEIQLLSSTNFGTSNYAGPTGVFIAYGDPTDFTAFITSTADPTADVGETYIGSTNPNSLIVYNSGHGRSEFRWSIPNAPYDKGDLAFAGIGGQTVTHTKGDTNYVPCIIPSANGNGAIGEWWITDIANTSFVVRNSGNGLTAFKWAIPRFDTGGKGASSFAGSGGVTITHNLNISGNYTPLIIPTENPDGHLGAVYVTDITANSFTVKNTGSAITTFLWLISNTTRGIVVYSNVSGVLSRALPLAGSINSLSTAVGTLSRTRQLAGEITSESQLTGALSFVAATRGFYYSKLGTNNLINPPDIDFNVTVEHNGIANFDFVIQNNAANRTIIADHLTEDYKIMRDDGTEILMGSIDSDRIEYFAEAEGGAGKRIRLSGYASFIDLAYLIYKRMADADAEAVGSVQDEDNSTATFTDYTTQANNDTINDVLPTFGAVNDALYVGKDETFFAAKIKYSTKGIQAANTTVVTEYSKGSGVWATLDCIDESYAFTEDAGTYLLYMPNKADDWAKDTVNGNNQYHIRSRITQGSYTTKPKLDRIWLSNADVCRVQFNAVSAKTILGYVLAGTGYSEDTTDQCPSTAITIRGEYDSLLRWIFGIGSALTWEDANGDKQRYDVWIDTSNKVHYKQQRGTDKGDLSADFRAVNNKMGYHGIGTRIFGAGGYDGINQKRAIVEDTTAQAAHKLREIVLEDSRITGYEALKAETEKSLTIRKAPLKEVSGDIDTKYWLDTSLSVGDMITINQPDWNLNDQELYIMRAVIDPSNTHLDLGTSQMHLEHMRSSLQRQMDISNVWMHGAVSTYISGPVEDNYERVDATTVYPVTMRIQVPSNARAINKVEISWALSGYKSSVKPTVHSGGGHIHTIPASGLEGAHLHTIPTSGLEGAHLHTIPTSGLEGAHLHTIPTSGWEGSHLHTIPSSGSNGGHWHTNSATGSEGGHNHIIQNAYTNGGHNHTIGNSGLEGGHLHTIGSGGGVKTSAGSPDYVWGTLVNLTAQHSIKLCDDTCLTRYLVESYGGTYGMSLWTHTHNVNIDHAHTESTEPNHIHTVPNSNTEPAHAHVIPDSNSEPNHQHTGGSSDTELDHQHTVPNSDTESNHQHTVPNSDTDPNHQHTVPNSDTDPDHQHSVPNSDTDPDHQHVIPNSDTTPDHEHTTDYGVYVGAGGTTLELYVNDILVANNYIGDQSNINITGWISTGSNTVKLQPIVGDNAKGRAEISSIATIFLENLK